MIVEAGQFTSELTLTNFSDKPKMLNLTLVGYVPTNELFQSERVTVPYSLELKAGQQRIIPNVIALWRAEEIPGIDSFGKSIAGPLFAKAENGDMSGIVIGARTGSPDAYDGQYSVFYTAVSERERFTNSAWIYGLQQNEENRGNVAIVNTGEVDDSSSEFDLEIYNGDGMLVHVLRRLVLAPKEFVQFNGILKQAPGNTQGYVRIRKHYDETGEYGNNPFLAYGVVNDARGTCARERRRGLHTSEGVGEQQRSVTESSFPVPAFSSVLWQKVWRPFARHRSNQHPLDFTQGGLVRVAVVAAGRSWGSCGRSVTVRPQAARPGRAGQKLT